MSKIQCEYNIFCAGRNQVTELHKYSFRSHNLIIGCSPDQLGATLSVKCHAQATGLLKFKITTRWTCHTISFPYRPTPDRCTFSLYFSSSAPSIFPRRFTGLVLMVVDNRRRWLPFCSSTARRMHHQLHLMPFLTPSLTV